MLDPNQGACMLMYEMRGLATDTDIETCVKACFQVCTEKDVPVDGFYYIYDKGVYAFGTAWQLFAALDQYDTDFVLEPFDLPEFMKTENHRFWIINYESSGHPKLIRKERVK